MQCGSRIGGETVSIARRSRYRLFAAFLAFLFLLEPLLPAVAWAAEPAPLDAAAATLVEAHPLGARELPEKRSATSREFLLPDGSHQVEVFLDPVNYQDAAGGWQPFQAAVEASQKPGFAVENRTNSFATYFGADGAGGGAVRVEKDGVALEMRPVLSSLTADTALPTSPQLIQDQVVYLDTFPGVSLLYETRPGALKETIVLADATAPTLQTTSTDFTYDGLTLLRLQTTQAGGVDPTSWQLTYLYDENGKPYAGVYRSPAASTTATVFGLVTTDRGDVVALLDAAGSPFAAYRYDAWGIPQGAGNLATGVWSQSTSLINATMAAAITTRQPLRYAGYAYDQESSLYYLSARYYDPATRQFTTKDPPKADGEESAYQYAGGDPVGAVDSSGQVTEKWIEFPMNDKVSLDSKKDWPEYLIRVLQRMLVMPLMCCGTNTRYSRPSGLLSGGRWTW